MKTQRRIPRTAALALAIAVLGIPAVTTAGAYAVTPAADSAHPAPAAAHDPATAQPHNLPGPFTEQETAERSAALQQVVSGEAAVQQRGASKVVQLGGGKGKKSKYVELGREKTDKIFTILAEFGNQVDGTTTYDPDGPDGPEAPVVKYGGTPGPAHNTIAEPDPKTDNSTAWQADYNQQHFQDLYFSHASGTESLAKYYEKQSSGRYSVQGEVSAWVKVPWNEARYGSNYCGASTCSSAWDLIRDATTAYVNDQKAQGRTDAQITADLAQYDQWDRYDFDGDGNFNEPDGYIDHFQIVHAGEDESAGGGAQAEDALWAHRWYAYGSDVGRTGPTGNKAGGTQIGSTGIWIGDYTLQPENGGLGVFAHEYGHDLGLPDEYDTTYIGENSTAFWTLMSSGSWMGTGKNAIGDLPDDMNAWDKLQLGWLNYATAKAGKTSTAKLGVAEYNTKDKQALVVQLPDKTVTTTITAPAEGAKQWWSGMGDNLSNTLTRSVDLTGAASASLNLKGWWDIEENYDYLYTEVSTDGGASWTALEGTANGRSIPRDGSDAPALTGTSGAYEDLAFPLDAYAGRQIQLRFRYLTDGGVAQQGFAADAITVTADGQGVLSDGAETDDNGWTAKGFSRIGASFTNDYPEYYVAENRQYVSYDSTLKTGPYNFGWTGTKPDWVEHFPYQTGLLVWLWDTSQADNNVGLHPGAGQILPVDAHAKPEKWSDGTLMRNRIQAYDAPFSWYPSSGFTLHKGGVAARVAPKLGSPIFDDHYGTYWYDSNPYGGVKVPDTNTRISIVSEPLDGSTLTLLVSPAHR
ncbi:immune inhibitor A domain-containing protein [Actinacidiphila sp. ITFR-21]|uniref:immune inhibitor A domain-containing protein n=1 Tax=Actinacidiphila sp. ITFR-21 TaxID=3075199 RepID=UPI00288973B7|nr:immune inhibitor A domain-containing protein [Streptomyces sp. ITFR-21]WNI15703.1 immune inhibitor A [Streptomyces sp. ITFR-21]